MNKIVRYMFLTVALFAMPVLFGSKAEAYGAGDEFRINMQFSFGPNSPSTPVPASPPLPASPPPPSYWSDVGDWQIFLKTHGEGVYLGSAYPNNNFDNYTEMATKDWQIHNGFPPTGIVDAATFAWSRLTNPTITYHLTDFDRKEIKRAKGEPKDDSQDPFRIPMGIPYDPNGPGGLPTSDPSVYWNDVFHWQDFLKSWEKAHKTDLGATQYMDRNYPNGNFDQTTQSATQEFQNKAKLSPSKPGQVDDSTWLKATTKDNSFNTIPMLPYPRVYNHVPPPDDP
jgi:hypothetical protein